jgi:hypothetical protein
MRILSAFRVLPIVLTLLALVAAHPASAGTAACCPLPDNGGGTADLPPACAVGYQGQMVLLNGLPAGATIDFNSQLGGFFNVVPALGGTLGGTTQGFDAVLQNALAGTGPLLGFNRLIAIPVTGRTDTAPRSGSPIQSFNDDLVQLQGQVVGDPDFDLLRITAGANFGLPSPGHTTLTWDGSNWNVDSFFDITYRIDFIGAPGSALAGLSGSTTGTARFELCHDSNPTPSRASSWGGIKAVYR